ncbi:MAG: hypothetical protein JWO82_3352 [Akkermansiaceae bacterium]|nr:hypothetical protein [Akkermansiaceae bacterium]
MTTPLTLLPAIRPAATVSAGWLPSADPVVWLEEMARCLSQGHPVAAYLVATSATDPRPAGIFLLPRSGVPAFGPRVQPLTLLLPGLHGPSNATLSAGVLPHEREFFFRYRVHFIHPTAGLVGFDPQDEIQPAKLLRMPPPGDSRWNHAVPVIPFTPKLRGIQVAEPPAPEELLAGAAGEIGDSPGQTPSQDHGLLDKTARLGKGLAGGAVLGIGGLFHGLGKLLGFLPGSDKIGKAIQPSLDQIEAWAKKNWQRISSEREAELERLLKLMETDPDAGLRHALPLNESPGRGIAAPGSKLNTRDTLFRHGNGGGSVDGWHLEPATRLQLERQYRAAALREIELGRHERAAYIYGNLLGDWNAAAKVLLDAGRHQDAISIYLHKLKDRAAAARALEAAGLLLQAAAMYAEVKQFEKAGDLHAQLGNLEQAREMWLAEVDELKNPIEKARILSAKLDDDTAALALLNLAWLSNQQPESALVAMFAICRKQNDPAAAAVLLRRLFEPATAPHGVMQKLEHGHTLIRHWPFPLLVQEFERLAYRLIGANLAIHSAQSAPLLRFLPLLAPDDSLLARDARRYTAQNVPVQVAKSGSPRGRLRPEQVIALDDRTRWDSLSTLPKGLSLAGYGREMLAVAQLRDTGCHSSALRTSDDPGDSPVLHLAVTSPRGSSRLFHFRKHHRIHYRALDRVRTPADDALGTLRGVLAVGKYGNDGDFIILLLKGTGSLTAQIYSELAELKQSITIDLAPPGVVSQLWTIAGNDRQLCLSAGHLFAWRHPDGTFSTVQLSENVVSLAISPVAGSREVLLTTECEVTLITAAKPGKPPQAVNLFTNPATAPVACFLPDGAVVVAWPGGGEIYPPGNRARVSATLDLPNDQDVWLDIAPRGTGGFALLSSRKNLVVFGR